MNETQARLDRLFDKDVANRIGVLAKLLTDRANESQDRAPNANYELAAVYLGRAIQFILGDLVQQGDE